MKKIFLMAAAAATLLASCAKEDTTPQSTLGDGKAQVGFSFRLPNAAFTRAEQAGSETNPDEISIKRVSVFVFDVSGVKATLNPYTQFNGNIEDAFVESTSGGYTIYTLHDDYLIETNSGTARIYVGVNLPTSLDKEYNTEAELLAGKNNANINPGHVNNPTESFAKPGEFTMFGQAMSAATGGTANIELEEITSASSTAADATIVYASVERVVSKVVGTSTAANFLATKEASSAPAAWKNGTQLEYTIESFNVYQGLSESFLALQAPKNSIWTSLYNDDVWSYYQDRTATSAWLTDGSKQGKNLPITTFVGIGSNPGEGPDALLTNLSGFYIGENYSNLNPNFVVAPEVAMSRNGYTTYAMVATKVTSNMVAKWNATDKEIVWDAPALGARTNPANNLIILNVPGEVEPVICETEAIATAITDGLIALDPLVYTTTTIKKYTYPQSYVHFLVWLNRDGFNDYNIGRNEFIHLSVTGVTGMSGQDLNNDGVEDGTFPGYPGDEDEPTKPIDPMEDDINNPEPLDPQDPIEGFSAKLKVVITVKDWTYRVTSGPLSK